MGEPRIDLGWMLGQKVHAITTDESCKHYFYLELEGNASITITANLAGELEIEVDTWA